ncbi:hypothetical protein T492DRAFT_833133 [Pavlovales sp. CCMP2436]|nr:hypothetical protein T492DRAFT_833133 [Pavlovales sp. CCMP2436]
MPVLRLSQRVQQTDQTALYLIKANSISITQDQGSPWVSYGFWFSSSNCIVIVDKLRLLALMNGDESVLLSIRGVVVATPEGITRLFSSFKPMSCMVDVAVMSVIDADWLCENVRLFANLEYKTVKPDVPKAVVAFIATARELTLSCTIGMLAELKRTYMFSEDFEDIPGDKSNGSELVRSTAIVYLSACFDERKRRWRTIWQPLIMMGKFQVTSPITEEEAKVTILSSLSSVPSIVYAQETPELPAPPPVKTKRVLSDKQRQHVVKANARRVEILVEAKATRVAAALELKRQNDTVTEYELAVKLASKYGFSTNDQPTMTQPTQPTPSNLSNYTEENRVEETPRQPPLRYQMSPPVKPIRYV